MSVAKPDWDYVRDQPASVTRADNAIARLHAGAFKHDVAELTRELAKMPQAECTLKHHFLPGVYLREITMPAGAFIVGKIHKTRHFNIIQRGRVKLYGAGHEPLVLGPCTFVSEPGVQKVLYIEEETVWTTVHLTNETNLEALEAELIEPDASYPELDRAIERAAIMQAARPLLETPK